MRLSTIRAAAWLAAGMFCLGGKAARADVVNLGILSFDTYIPDQFLPDGTVLPGLNALDISNLTGGFSLTPGFPASTPIIFQSASLTLHPAGSVPVPALGDIGPGPLLDAFFNPPIQVPDSDVFNSAEFTATLNKTVFKLDGGTVFTADSSLIDVTLLPSIGNNLTAGIDFALISVSGTISIPTSVPEPATWALLVIVIVCSGYRARKEPKPAGVSINSDNSD